MNDPEEETAFFRWLADQSGLSLTDAKLLRYSDWDKRHNRLNMPDDLELARRRRDPQSIAGEPSIMEAIPRRRKVEQVTKPPSPAPKSRVASYARAFPFVWATIDAARNEFQARGGHISGYAFLNDDVMLRLRDAFDDVPPPRSMTAVKWESNVIPQLCVQAVVLASWRVSQGIYRFDPWLRDELLTTPITGDLPSDLLLRLPAWGIYVETPGHIYDGAEIHGFFAAISEIAGTPTLTLAFNYLQFVDNLITPTVSITLGGKLTIYDALLRMFKRGHDFISLVEEVNPDLARVIKEMPATQQAADERAKELTPEVAPLLSLLLYLCSDEPDLSQRPPVVQQPKKIKRGLRYFPPDQETTIDVGMRIGAKVRAALMAPTRPSLDDEHQPTGRRMPYHVRKPHFHLYWYGKRTAEHRESRLRWLHPIIVNRTADLDSLPAVLHEVEE
jgi:hypothetical protein